MNELEKFYKSTFLTPYIVDRCIHCHKHNTIQVIVQMEIDGQAQQGCPVLVNTSFNVRGEPIVNSPTDAFNCFMGTELDYLVIGNCILDKKKQDKNLIKNYKSKFELD